MFCPSDLTESLKSEAQRFGFSLAGACPAVSPTGFSRLSDWIEQDYAGEMDYFRRRQHAYQHPKHVMANTKSILVLGLNYRTIDPVSSVPGSGRISRYAWGSNDYHNLIREKLQSLKHSAETLLSQMGIQKAQIRGIVDTAPFLEREFAWLAGLGWFAKNTMLIHPKEGSWFFLAALLMDCLLEYDPPFAGQHCGTCTACLDVCPTNAFVEPGMMDAKRCISYLTIEHKTAIPVELRKGIGEWVFGCDLCQEVCPWNRKAPKSTEADFFPLDDHNPINLRELFKLTDQQFRDQFRKTPLWRPRRRGILRNAAIVLGNHPATENLPALQMGLNDSEPLIRGACAWALGCHRNDSQVLDALTKRHKIEIDVEVKKEIENAINSLDDRFEFAS